MIIQTGNRTDIPAFYSDWFAGRLREGFVLVRNPFHQQSITRYVLDPSIVDLIVFCTKNPEPMLKYMGLLQPYRQYWFVTITPYGKDIEPNVPDKSAVMETFIRLSSIVGPDNMCWRYDPIFIDEPENGCAPRPQAPRAPRTEICVARAPRPQAPRAPRTEISVDWHIKSFRTMCETLAGHTHTAVISFIDLYEKVKRNFPEARPVPFPTQLELTSAFAEIAREYDMVIKPCGESSKLAAVGADCSGCMTKKVFETAVGRHLILPPNPNNRKECACFITGDIGAYNSCGHFCRYCYANADRNAVIRSMKNHDPKSPLLIGHVQPEDKITQAKQASWIDPQMRLEDLLC